MDIVFKSVNEFENVWTYESYFLYTRKIPTFKTNTIKFFIKAVQTANHHVINILCCDSFTLSHAVRQIKFVIFRSRSGFGSAQGLQFIEIASVSLTPLSSIKIIQNFYLKAAKIGLSVSSVFNRLKSFYQSIVISGHEVQRSIVRCNYSREA